MSLHLYSRSVSRITRNLTLRVIIYRGRGLLNAGDSIFICTRARSSRKYFVVVVIGGTGSLRIFCHRMHLKMRLPVGWKLLRYIDGGGGGGGKLSAGRNGKRTLHRYHARAVHAAYGVLHRKTA